MAAHFIKNRVAMTLPIKLDPFFLSYDNQIEEFVADQRDKKEFITSLSKMSGMSEPEAEKIFIDALRESIEPPRRKFWQFWR